MKDKIDLSNAIYVGVDLHCDQITCCYLKPNKVEANAVYHLKENGLSKFQNAVSKDCHLLVEASTSTFAFQEAISCQPFAPTADGEFVGSVTIVYARKMQLIFKDKKKTDKVDAKKLAIFLNMQMTSGHELIKAVYKPAKQIQELRSLFVTYKMFLKQLVQIKNRVHALTRQNLLSYRKQDIFTKKNREEILAIDNIAFKSQIKLLYLSADNVEKEIEQVKELILLGGETYSTEINLLTSR